MLRPATPLAILLFIAFVLLLLSVISTPIVKGIPLASFQGVQFGVFGYCKGTQCTGVQVGYTTSTLLSIERLLWNTEAKLGQKNSASYSSVEMLLQELSSPSHALARALDTR
jgi:hypothetical protein